MANKLIKSSAFANIVKCNYATATAVQQTGAGHLVPSSPEVKVLPNKVNVANLLDTNKTTSLSLIFKCGSRNEHPDNNGITQYIRNCAGLKTAHITALKHYRQLNQMGAKFSVTSDRETLQYSVTGLFRENVDVAFAHLNDIATKPLFRHWELKDVPDRVQLECELQTPTATALELLHKAAYQSKTLGRWLFSPSYNYDNFTIEELFQYVSDGLTLDQMAVVGYGVEIDILKELAETVAIPPTSKLPADKAVYKGGLERRDDGNILAYVAVAGEGAAFGSEEAASFRVASALLGSDSLTKYSPGSGSPIGAAIVKAGGSGVGYPINLNYSDSGLFGYFLQLETTNIEKAVNDVHSAFMNLKVTEASLKIAKSKAKTQLYLSADSPDQQLEQLSKSLLFLGKNKSIDDMAAEIDKVTVSSVNKAIKKATSGKLSMAAYGNIDNVPYLA